MLVNTPRARKEGGGGGRKERERKKETEVLPATTHRPRTRQKGRAPSYDERQEGEERKERRKERERERKGEERKEGVPSYEQSSRDTPKKESGDPEYSIQENPRKQRKKGEEKGEDGGLSARQVPMNLKLALTAMVTLCPAKVAGCFDRCGHVKA